MLQGHAFFGKSGDGTAVKMNFKLKFQLSGHFNWSEQRGSAKIGKGEMLRPQPMLRQRTFLSPAVFLANSAITAGKNNPSRKSSPCQPFVSI